MTLKEIALGLENRVLAFLNNVGGEVSRRKIFIETPIRFWEDGYQDYEWWLLIYPWTRVDRPPDNALIAQFKLLAGYGKVRLVLDLGRVDGRLVDTILMHESLEVEDADVMAGLGKQMAHFEQPTVIKEVADKIEDYIKNARRESKYGPREWSPRLEGSKKKKEEPVRVNLAEQKEWRRNWTWDSSDFDEMVHRLTDEYYLDLRSMEGECDSLIEDIMGPFYNVKAEEGPREWSPRARKIGPEGVEKACKGWREHKLEEVDSLIADTIERMFDKACTPHEGDLQHALAETKDWFVENPDLDYEIWDPLIDQQMEGKKGDWSSRLRAAKRSIMLGLMNQIHLSGEQGHYDRYIEFDLMNSQEVVDLIHAWPVEDRGWVEDALRFNDFKSLRNEFLERFFGKLEKDMADEDPSNRADWPGQWQEELKDKERIEAVRKEIFEYLKTAPELPEDE